MSGREMEREKPAEVLENHEYPAVNSHIDLLQFWFIGNLFEFDVI